MTNQNEAVLQDPQLVADIEKSLRYIATLVKQEGSRNFKQLHHYSSAICCTAMAS